MPVTKMYTGIADTKIQEDIKYVVDFSSAFADLSLGADVTYTVALENGQAFPDWLALNMGSGIMQGTPEHDDANKIYHITVTASSTDDPDIQYAESYYLYAENVNDAPVVTTRVESTVHKAGDSGPVSASITVNDSELVFLTTFKQPPYTSYSSEVIATGETVVTQSNPFGDSMVETRGDYGVNYAYQFNDGSTLTQAYSQPDDVGNWNVAVLSSKGDNYTELNNVVEGDGYTDYTAIQNGARMVLGSLVQLDATYTYRVYASGDTTFEYIAASGQASIDNTVYYPSAMSDNLVYLNQAEYGSSSGVYGTHMYNLTTQEGVYGTISLDKNQNWGYSLDMDDPDTIDLEAGSNGYESFVLEVFDGEATTSTTISIAVVGATNQIIPTVQNTLTGDDLLNSITGEAAAEIIYGLAGNDELHGAGGNDVIFGGADNDRIFGGEGDDVIYTGEGADVAIGGSGSDEIHLAADGVWGDGYAAYNVSTNGSIGTEEYQSLSGLNRFSDVVSGGSGSDTTNTLVLTDEGDALFLEDVYSSHHESLSLKETNGGHLSIARIEAVKTILAGAGNDIIDLTTVNYDIGTSSVLSIYGEAGDDVIWGGGNDNILDGGAGNDSLAGGIKTDHMTGGLGKDKFIFTATAGNDVITDFSSDEGDSIHLYYRSSTLSVAEPESVGVWLSETIEFTLNGGSSVLTWDTQDYGRKVEIQLNVPIEELTNEFIEDHIVFHEII
jgi:VCBS repeat-containing protein